MTSPSNESLYHLEAFLNQFDLHLVGDQVPDSSWSNFLDKTGPLKKLEDGKGFYFSTRTDFPQFSLKYPPVPYGHFYRLEDLTDPNFGDFLTIGLASGFAIYLKIGSSLISLYTDMDYSAEENKWEFLGGTATTDRMLNSIRRVIESTEDLKHLPKQEFIYFQKDFKREMHVFGTFKLGQNYSNWKDLIWEDFKVDDQHLVEFESLDEIITCLNRNSSNKELIREFFVEKLIELIPHEEAPDIDEYFEYWEPAPNSSANRVKRTLDTPEQKIPLDAKGRKPGYVNRLRNALADLLENWANNLEHRARKNRDNN